MTHKGFEKANSGNLPCVDIIMVANFFKNSKFVGAEMKGIKNARAGRESYGDDAVGYVQLKRSGNFCQVQARVTPEHKVRSTCYTVHLTIDEEEGEIKSVECQDCAASSGGCKHAIALLMWTHRRSEDPPPTAVECYWRKSTLSKVGTQLKYVLASDILPQKTEHVKIAKIEPCSFLKKIVTHVGNAEGQLLKHFKPANVTQKLSLSNLSYQYLLSGGSGSSIDFKNFCLKEIDDEWIAQVAQETGEQSESSAWHELRFGRITASKLFQAARCKTSDGSLVESVFGAKLRDTEWMARGRRLEPLVTAVVSKKVGSEFSRVGLFLSRDEPFIGASPDAMNDKYVVEIKCPANQKTMKTYCTNGKLTPKYMAQIQLQMKLTGRHEGLFILADPQFEENEEVTIIHVAYDAKFTDDMLSDALGFWRNSIFPKLMDKVIRK